MARSIFASFHYDFDHSRVQQVLNMGVVTGQEIVSAQKWEEVKKNGDAAIKKWIDDQMKGKSAVVVLVGAKTASREWVNYEIRKAWDEYKPIVGIRIHGLKDFDGQTATSGANPFANISLSNNGGTLDKHLDLWAPAGSDSKAVYASIEANIDSWVANAKKRAR